ncbi:hypothetical protein BD779DRAFT_1575442 [Infundibulicybe gibba]|nr:hypothetical protein BD779DRAFT_1575442 [Infundibulicybe gibba]
MPLSLLAEPSEYRAYQQETPIYDGRCDAKFQVETTSPAVQLFHPVFGHFLDDLSSDSPIPPDIVNATVCYMSAASAMYDNEDNRARALDPALRNILGCALVTIVNADGSSSDVIPMPRAGKIPEAVTPLLRESQNEFGAGGCDPSILAGLSAARYWAQPEVATAALHYTTPDARPPARCEPEEFHPRFLPSVRAYRDEVGNTVEFKYIRPLRTEAQCVVFLARTTTNPPKDNLAPQLFYFGRVGVLDGDPLYKNLRMVVMEYVEGKTLDTMHNARRVTPTLKNRILDQIQRALNVLHEQDYVFGDLRRANVIVTKDQGVKLAGFGWAGVHDKTTYPLLISPDLDWPPGHDEYMMARLLP